MTTLRVQVRAAEAADAAVPWALFDAAGLCIDRGHGPPGSWPRADAVDFVVAAGDVRLAALALPPLPAARLAAAAAFALEDRVAGPADLHWLAVARERVRGQVIVVVVARTLVASLNARAAAVRGVDQPPRVLAEPELAEADDEWCWCVGATENDDGFVRLPDGSAFPVGACGAGEALPAELRLALAQSTPAGAPSVRVRGNASDATLARWQHETSVTFVRGSPWVWSDAPPGAFAAATNLLQRELAPTPVPTSGMWRPAFAPALWIAAAALVLHVTASLGEWAWWRVGAWRTAQSWTAVATGAGIAASAAATPATARAALRDRYATLRHARGLPAPDDAVPLLARTASALAVLPPGTLKSATYAAGHWTLDLQGADAALVRELDARLRQAGTPALVATTPAGTRLRLGSF